MQWTTPDFEEMSLNCEINCYTNADVQLSAVDGTAVN